MADQPHIVLAISRQMGSGATLLGQRVAQRLGFAYFDREILGQAARTLGVEAADLAEYEERMSSFWERVLASLAAGGPDASFNPPPLTMAFDDRLHAVQQRIIRDIAARCDAVIVGRGGGLVLSGQSGLVRVFTHAPLDFRVRTIMDAYHLTSEEETRKLVMRCDHDRQRYGQTLFKVDWTDTRLYDLCLNVASTGLDLGEKMILDLVRHRAAQLGRPLAERAASA